MIEGNALVTLSEHGRLMLYSVRGFEMAWQRGQDGGKVNSKKFRTKFAKGKIRNKLEVSISSLQ